MFKRKYILIGLVLTASLLRADGLMMPENEDYPKDFLRHRMSSVMVRIHGLVAETAVYSEFENEWTDSTDAVYSFPLPSDARATAFYYWEDDRVYQAVLKVQEQSTNPGTGEGGVTARVNEYLGPNSIRIRLKGIRSGEIQRIELQYVQICSYYQGEISYEFPLAGGELTDYPLDHLELNLTVDSNSPITEYELDYSADADIRQPDDNHLDLSFFKAKAYIQNNISFRYTADQSELGVDFYTTKHDSLGGHFNLFIRPASDASSDNIYKRRIFFLLGNSSSMFGYKLDQSIAAIEQCLDLLNEEDEFNLIIFSYYINAWKQNTVPATDENIQAAKQMLSEITSGSGTNLSDAIITALGQISSDDLMNGMLIFTDGYAAIEPDQIERLNTSRCGIFPVGIGDDVARARLEMTAALNYGFVTYFDEDDNLKSGIFQLFQQISRPVVKDISLEYGKIDLKEIIPEKLPALYAGGDVFLAGRYSASGESVLSLGGKSPAGPVSYDYQLNYTDLSDTNRFAASIWAKEKIDALERIVEIYGQTDSLKNALIDLSLSYNIRCRYTAYTADYQTVPGADGGPWAAVEIDHESVQPETMVLSCFPNPFNAETTVYFFISDLDARSSTKLIKVYNVLGQLVAVYDLGNLQQGFHTYHLQAVDFEGNPLPSGLYFVRLQIGSSISTIRVTLLK